jgi:hypothetical protein
MWLRWFRWVALGEGAGFVAPAVIGAASTAWPTPAMVAALLAAGAVEGGVLGWAQAHVLVDIVARLPRRAFVLATAAGAVAAYSIGLIPVLLGESLTRWPAALQVGSFVVGGAALLATIGTAQWLVLRRVRTGSAWWIPTTAGAWAAGLLVFTAVAPPLWQPGQPLALLVAIGVLGGLVMAATVAALTGLAAVRLAPAVRA